MGKNTLSEIRLALEGYIGQKVRVKANSGRRKTVEKTGVLEDIYPSVFVVKLDENQSVDRVSYSYADVLTEAVQLSLLSPTSDKLAVKYVKTAPL